MRFIVAFSRALTRKRTPVRPGPDAAGPRSAGSTSYFRSRFLFASLEVSGEGTISGFIRLALLPARRSPSHRARFPWLTGWESVEFVVLAARRFVDHRCLNLASAVL